MPAYKTHSIHGEVILPKIDKRIDIKKEDLKVFCFGPDALVATDYKVYDYQHRKKVRLYFEALMQVIKENKLQDNSEVMAFLYGQLDHYILDVVCHPLVYYMTEDIPQTKVMTPHSLMEMWIDDYIMEKYNKKGKFYFHKWFLKTKGLRLLIDKVYNSTYGARNETIKYSLGIAIISIFDFLARNNALGIAPVILKSFNIGDLVHRGPERVIPYLNLEHKKWTIPANGEIVSESFDDLWKKSIEMSLETIYDVNKYIYDDKPLNEHYILSDSSYNTGVSCTNEEKFLFVKKYHRK